MPRILRTFEDLRDLTSEEIEEALTAPAYQPTNLDLELPIEVFPVIPHGRSIYTAHGPTSAPGLNLRVVS